MRFNFPAAAVLVLAAGCVEDLAGSRCSPEDTYCGPTLVCRQDTDQSWRCLPPASNLDGSVLPSDAGPGPDAAVTISDASGLADAAEPAADVGPGVVDAGTGSDSGPADVGGGPDASGPDATVGPDAGPALPPDASAPGSDAAVAPDAGPATCSPDPCPVGTVCVASQGVVSCSPVSIAAGENHTCTVKADGTMYCWGRNEMGQVGSGTPVVDPPFSSPVKLTGSWKKVVAGPYFTCALTASGGAIWCWGATWDGRTGQPQGTATPNPSRVGSSDGYQDLALGAASGFGLKADGSVVAWGQNGDGELGLGAAVPSEQYGPRDTALGSGWQEIAGGREFACGIKNGQPLCWGHASAGRLGDPAATDTLVPIAVKVAQPTGWSSLALGLRHGCALRGEVLACWGNNDDGQLGSGAYAYANPPTEILNHEFVAVAAAYNRTCAIDTSRALWCWGETLHGGIGHGTATPARTPAQVTFAAGALGTHPGTWTAVGVGKSHSCGVQTDGSVWCWGSADDGRLGNGVVANSFQAVQLPGTGWTSVSAGYTHTCGVQNGQALCWGGNGLGQLGTGGPATLDPTPAPISGSATDVKSVVAGIGHTCAIRGNSNAVWCWGDGDSGQIGQGYGYSSKVPLEVQGTDASKLSLLNDCSLGIRAGLPTPKEIFRWGDHWVLPTRTDEATPKTWVDLSCAPYTDLDDPCLAIDDAGAVWTFPGDEPLTGADAPAMKIQGSFKRVAQGGTHGCALSNASKLFCFGKNWSGQVGDGTGVERPTAVAVAATDDWSEVSAGYYHTCGIKAAGAAHCWGANWAGQVGGGTITGWDDQYKPMPVRLPSSASNETFKQVSAGMEHTCAVADDTTLWCWGGNGAGQLGNGKSGVLTATLIAVP